MASRNRLLRFAQEIEKSWIGAEFGEMRIDAHEGKPDGMFALGLGQPAKRVVEVVQPRVDDRDFVSSDPLFAPLADNLVK